LGNLLDNFALLPHLHDDKDSLNVSSLDEQPVETNTLDNAAMDRTQSKGTISSSASPKDNNNHYRTRKILTNSGNIAYAGLT
jgi:Flp pilus assembly protein TadG